MNAIFGWFDNNKNKETSIILFLKFLYSISNDWIYSIINIAFPIYLSPLFENKDKKLFIIIFSIYVILSLWFSMVNAYKNRRNKKDRNVKFISEEINAAMTTLDNYINNEYLDNSIFEFASDLVVASIYNSLQGIVGCEIRVSVIQQFIDDSQKNCVMLSRRSKTRQKCRKSQRKVKYEKNKDYYYQKILVDNKDSMIIFNEEQVNKHFIYQSKDRKSQIKQYIGIPDKNSTDEIIFILQLDAMKENAYGKDKNEINVFYDDYIYPYICFLRHAYNIEKNLRKKEGGNNE